MQGQSEAGDPLDRPIGVRRVDGRPGDLRPIVVARERHSAEGGRISRPELFLDDDAVAVR